MKGKYGEYQLAYCAHYVGDLSMPLRRCTLPIKEGGGPLRKSGLYSSTCQTSL